VFRRNTNIELRGRGCSLGSAIVVTGSTLSHGGHNIAACYGGTPGSNGANTQCTSHAGVEQFGINLVDNATPNVGVDPICAAGAPCGNATATYGDFTYPGPSVHPDEFTFHSGDTVASSTVPPGAINSTVYTVSYLANIAGATPAGVYTTQLTYTATATF